ncbi:MAG: NAD-dependent epimerase/dehydratase family protein [Chloroflexota bacterium]
MKIFLTGATGFIGRRLVERLQVEGHQLIGLARTERSVKFLKDRGVQVHQGDLQQLDSLKSGAANADVVIHTAMPNPEDFSDLSELGHIAIQAQAALIEGLSGKNKILIATSGAGPYGDTGQDLVDETSPFATQASTQLFGVIEKQLLNASSEGVRGIVIRPSIVYGHGGSYPVVTLIQSIQRRGYGYYVEGIDSHISTVHVDDLVDLYLLNLEQQPVGELFNAVGEIVSTRDLVASAMVAAKVNGDMRPINVEEAMRTGFVGQYMAGNMRVSAEKAKRMLGWKPNRISILDDLKVGSYQHL